MKFKSEVQLEALNNANTNTNKFLVSNSGTVSFRTGAEVLSDIGAGGGGGSIPHAIASGTDTYTATISGVTAYSDGDAYLIRFPNGNTTVSTLNINALGARPLFRNNDGQLIGGDIIEGGELLCVYNSTAVEFQCIGTSPNILLSYVTNDDAVTINKGQVVYAFGGVGDRMTVKLASNLSDATSAQTVGLVLSTSIAPNQRGLIIIQGLLDNLNILPTPTFANGQTIYLGTTPGSITNVKPFAPNHLVYLGVVTTANTGNAGRMYVRVQNGYELDELHNVQAQNPNNKDTLYYDSTVTPKQWKTAGISNILGYIPANDSNVVHKTLDETIDGFKTFVKDANINGVTVGLGGGDLINNTAVGFRALAANTLGTYNTAIGNEVLSNNTTGSKNIALGEGALKQNIATSELTAIGYSALQLNTQGEENTAVGAYALNVNTFGNSNTAIGFKALVTNSLGSSNTAIGSRALSDNAGGGLNTAIGTNALAYNIGGSDNTAIGMQALFKVTNNAGNTAIGSNSLRDNTSSNNTAIGAYALSDNTAGTQNVAIGPYALHTNITSSYNVAIGGESLRECKGGFNTAIGYATLTNNTTGSDNMAIGYTALYNNSIGTNNIGIGVSALYENLSGSGNIGIGTNAFNTYKLGVNNIGIGSGVEVFALEDNNSIVIGATAVGLGSNTTVLGNDLTDKTFIRGRVTLGSGADNGLDRLQVNGYTVSDGYKIPLGQATQYLMADGNTSTGPSLNFLPLAGGNMTGNINWSAQNGNGLNWSNDTDTASIKFYSTGDAGIDNRLEFNISDNNTEYFRWTTTPSGNALYELMRLAPTTLGSGNAVLTVSGKVLANSFEKSGGNNNQILAAAGGIITAGTNITITGGTISSTGGSTLSMGGISATANANGATITGSVLNLAAANPTNGGVVTSGNQIFSTGKKFTDNLQITTTTSSASLGFDFNGTTTGTIICNSSFYQFQAINSFGWIFKNSAGNVNPLTLEQSGNATFTGTVTASGGFFNSDIRLKNVLERDGDAVKFTWKDGQDDKIHIGYIAQEVQEKYPDQVSEDANGMLTVNYIEVLVAKIQELENRIKQLEK